MGNARITEEEITEDLIKTHLVPGAHGIAQDKDKLSFQYSNLSFKEAKKAFEQEYLNARLEENDGNISQTAEQVGIERSHLHKKMKSFSS